MSSKITIPEEARQKYLERRWQDLESCRKALSARDFECFATVGHQIKGNAATFGFDELTPIAINMENFGLAKDVKKLEEVLNLFEAYLNRIKN